MKSIYKKELRTYFYTAVGYVFIGVYLLIYACFFILYNIMGDNADIGTLLDNSVVAFVLLMPILTMRLFAEERHSRTDKVYLSAPLKIWQIVLGKYFAACTVFLITQTVTIISGIIMVISGGQTIAEILAVLTGYILVGMVFTALGMFASAITENQIISAIVSLALCLILYLSDMLFSVVSGTVFEVAVNFISITQHYKNFTVGIFDCVSVVYFISLSAIFTIFTMLRLESERCGR